MYGVAVWMGPGAGGVWAGLHVCGDCAGGVGIKENI